jgi:hypothetical protein
VFFGIILRLIKAFEFNDCSPQPPPSLGTEVTSKSALVRLCLCNIAVL